jgi:hypothetical protein
MASKSKPAASSPRRFQLIRLLLRPHNRSLVMTALVIAASIGSSIYAWRRWGEPAVHAADYIVTPDQITVTPQPTWIQSNVKAEVLQSAAFGRLNLRDRKLVEQVARAFALHPWVAKVVRVEKRFPAQVTVELQYRRPVAVVKIDARGESGLLFIDEESVLLPSADFAPGQARSYLRIMAAGETPASVYGTPWGSERIAGAARVAAAWGNRWQPLGLYWIVAARPASGELLYELRTQDDKVRIIWGPDPGRESSGGPSSEQKIAALEQYVHDKGPLNKKDGPAIVDLRDLAASADQTARGTSTLPASGRR